VKLSVTWLPTPRDLAQAFCDLHSDGQAQFFIEVAKIVEEWDDSCVGGAGSIMQMHDVGRRLKKEIGARTILNDIADAADEPVEEQFTTEASPYGPPFPARTQCPYCGEEAGNPHCANCSEALP
jgi:hypothetical protein